jgi:ABC-2 type transport system ATP-binding protein
MSILEVTNLTKKFGACLAVDDISFNIDKPGIIGLLGPNGAGKTTTIYLILGLITATSGSIKVFGKDIEKHRQEILQNVNFSSAYVSLPSNLKVIENLRFFSHLYNVKNWRERITELLDQFGMKDLIEKKTGELSSGQHTKLNLVKALINKPSLLFLDEATASLDPVSARLVRARLKEITAEHKVTVFYTSHNMLEIEELCDEVMFIHKGKIVMRDTPKKIMETLKQKNMEDVFVELTKDEIE